MGTDGNYTLAIDLLNRALSYAESTVSSTSASLRNISLDSIDRRQLNLTSALGNDWDTLGWVAFAQGDLNKAERYVSAAWQLEQPSEVAEPLRGDLRKAQQQKRSHSLLRALARRTPTGTRKRERLAALVTTEKTDSIVAEHQQELRRLRTLKVRNSSEKQQ
jgi:hypothetical protein